MKVDFLKEETHGRELLVLLLDLLNCYHCILPIRPDSLSLLTPQRGLILRRIAFAPHFLFRSQCPWMTDRFDGSRCAGLLPVFCQGMTTATARSQETDPREDRLMRASGDVPGTPIRPFFPRGSAIILISLLWLAASPARGQQSYIPWASGLETGADAPASRDQGVNEPRQPAQAEAARVPAGSAPSVQGRGGKLRPAPPTMVR